MPIKREFNPQEWADQQEVFAKRAFERWLEWNDQQFTM